MYHLYVLFNMSRFKCLADVMSALQDSLKMFDKELNAAGRLFQEEGL